MATVLGRVAIQYVETSNPKDNFTFKCHRSAELINGFQEIYAVHLFLFFFLEVIIVLKFVVSSAYRISFFFLIILLNLIFLPVFQVNDICFHPTYGTLATVGSDGRISFWDKDARTKLKTSDAMPLPVTRVTMHSSGQIMAYAIGYDWNKVGSSFFFFNLRMRGFGMVACGAC